MDQIEIGLQTKMTKINTLWNQLSQIPEETVERLGLDEMLLDGKVDEAAPIIHRIIAFREQNQPAVIGYHTTKQKYEIGDYISPQDSAGKYKGKVFVSRSIETAFTGDYPEHCYRVQVDAWRPDPDDLTGRDWGYTLTPAKVLEEIPLSKVLRAKRLMAQKGGV